MSVLGAWPADEGREHARAGGAIGDCPYSGAKGDYWRRAFESYHRSRAATERWEPRREDACGCFKDAGCWGDHGWHWKHYSRADARHHLKNPNDHGEQIEPTEEQIDRFLAIYTQPVAYERCPAYVKAVRKRQEHDELLAATEGYS